MEGCARHRGWFDCLRSACVSDRQLVDRMEAASDTDQLRGMAITLSGWVHEG